MKLTGCHKHRAFAAILAVAMLLQLVVGVAGDVLHEVAATCGVWHSQSVVDASSDPKWQANAAGDFDMGTLGDGGCAYHAHVAHFGLAPAGYEFPMIRGRALIPDPLAADTSRSPFEIYRPPIL